MKVREIMNRRVCQISSSAMLSEAVGRMRALDVDVLPVVENHRIVGLVAEADLAPERLPGDMDPQITPVRSAMSSDVACCTQDDSVEKASEILETSHARRLIVLDSRGAAVGVVSLEDLTSKVGGHSRERSPMEGEEP